MPAIRVVTPVNAPIAVVFDLSRSIDLHKISTAHTNEEAVAGRISGLIGLGESVTWKARHFGITQLLASKITVFEPPNYFVDEWFPAPLRASGMSIFSTKKTALL